MESNADLIVVRGDVLVDYIPTLAYASHAKIMLLLVKPEKIDKDSLSALKVYAKTYKNVVIIGGKNAVSEDVEKELKNLGFYVTRLWDWDRYGTAARIAIELWKSSENAVIVDAENSNNFIYAGMLAIKTESPVLYSKKDSLPKTTEKALKILNVKNAIMVGNFSSEVIEKISSLGISVKKVSVEKLKKQQNFEKGNVSILFVLAFSISLLIIGYLAFKKIKRTEFILLTPDEEKIVELLKLHGTLTQKRIAELSGFSKPKTSRLISSLSQKGVIEKIKYKKTQKIRLKVK